MYKDAHKAQIKIEQGVREESWSRARIGMEDKATQMLDTVVLSREDYVMQAC